MALEHSGHVTVGDTRRSNTQGKEEESRKGSGEQRSTAVMAGRRLLQGCLLHVRGLLLPHLPLDGPPKHSGLLAETKRGGKRRNEKPRCTSQASERHAKHNHIHTRHNN